MKKTIPGFDNYEISKDGIITNIKTGKEVPAHNGKVRLYDRPKHKVAFMVSELVDKLFADTVNRRSGMSAKIRQLSKDGLTRKEISEKIMPNQGYVDNVVYQMNFKGNEAAIVEDLKTMSSEDVCKKYDISARFIPEVIQ